MRLVGKQIIQEGKIEKAFCCATCFDYDEQNRCCKFWGCSVLQYERCNSYGINKYIFNEVKKDAD